MLATSTASRCNDLDQISPINAFCSPHANASECAPDFPQQILLNPFLLIVVTFHAFVLKIPSLVSILVLAPFFLVTLSLVTLFLVTISLATSFFALFGLPKAIAA